MRHQTISFIKSGIRIAGYVCLLASGLRPDGGSWFEWMSAWVITGAILLVCSEVLGILEEIGHE